jgi:hypothetical protein
VIGKRGATAQSLRTLLRALGTKNDARYNLKIVDNGFPSHEGSSDHDHAQAPAIASAQADDGGVATDDPVDEPDEPEEDTKDELPEEEPESDVISKTRQELEELDDLDV